MPITGNAFQLSEGMKKLLLRYGVRSITAIEIYLATHSDYILILRNEEVTRRATLSHSRDNQMLSLAGGERVVNPSGDEVLNLEDYVCNSCGEHIGEPSQVDDDYYCESCFSDRYFYCESCGNACRHEDEVLDDDGDNTGRCPSCAESGSFHLETRATSDEEIESKKTGNIVKSLRSFGIELETCSKNPKLLAEATHKIDKRIGVYGDGSLSGGIGLEFATPIANGEKAEELIEKLCETLNANKVGVNVTCGYHVHVDMRDIDSLTSQAQYNVIRGLWLFYLAFEDVLLSFLPMSRRTNGRYCMPLRSEYHFMEVAKSPNITNLERIWYRVANNEQANRAKSESKHGSRYRGINLHTLFSARHPEIRYHSGTTNPKKILEWANLHLAIVDKTYQNEGFYFWTDETRRIDYGENKLLTAVRSVDMNEKTNIFFSLLSLPKESEDYFRTRQAFFMSKYSKPKQVSKGERAKAIKLLTEEQ